MANQTYIEWDEVDGKAPRPKFLRGVGSQSLSPPMIIEGGIRYVAETPEKMRLIVLENGDSIDYRPNYFAGAYAEDDPGPPGVNYWGHVQPKPPEPEHELDCIQRMSEGYRALPASERRII